MTGREAKEAIDPQTIFGDPAAGVAYKANVAGQSVRQASERIEKRTVRATIKRVEGEIPPAGIGNPVCAERNHSMAPISFHVLAKRGHLGQRVAELESNRAMVDASGVMGNVMRLRTSNDL